MEWRGSGTCMLRAWHRDIRSEVTSSPFAPCLFISTCVCVCVFNLPTGLSMSSSFVFSLTFCFTAPFSFPVFINSYAGCCGGVFRSPDRTIAFVSLCWETWSMYWKANPACQNRVGALRLSPSACGNVMFLHLSVSHSVHRRGVSGQTNP